MLARLLDEQLNEVDHSSIAEHVETCVRCQERLKELTSQALGVLDWEPFDRLSSDPWLTMDHLLSGVAGNPALLINHFDTNATSEPIGTGPCRSRSFPRSTATRFWPSSVMAAWESSTKRTSSV